MAFHWRLWVILGVLLNLFVPFFYLDRLEARVIIIAAVASLTLMTVLTGVYGFTRILGLGHILWIPLLYFLWIRLDRISDADFIGIWVRSLIVYNAVSLVIDIIDIIRYVAGDREEMVKGL